MTAPSPFLMEHGHWFTVASFVLFAVACALWRLEDEAIWIAAIVPGLICTVILQQGTYTFGEWDASLYVMFGIPFVFLHAIVGYIASFVSRGLAGLLKASQ